MSTFQNRSQYILPALATSTLIVGSLSYFILRKIFSDNRNKNHIEVASLHVYPVKSCRGMDVQEWEVSEGGFKFDRGWVIVHEETGKFVTQRQIPQMCFIQAEVDPGNGSLTLSVADDYVSTLRQDTERQYVLEQFPKVTITREQYEKMENDAKLEQHLREVAVWERSHRAVDMGDKVAQWLSAFLSHVCQRDRHVRLCMFPSDGIAQMEMLKTKTNYKLAEMGDLPPEYGIRFADRFPFLLTSLRSLEALSADYRAQEKDAVKPLEMLRFRPNIVVDGSLEPWSEDSWRTVDVISSDSPSAEPLRMFNVKPCTRCSIPSIDYTTSTRQEEVQRLLNTTRMGKAPMDKPLFGVNLVHNNGALLPGTPVMIRVGDKIQVTSTQEAPRLNVS